MAKKRIISEANRAFKGVWIPANLWLNEDLEVLDAVLLTEIDSLDGKEGCYASNKHFADFVGKTPSWISKKISSLKEKGYIKVFYRKNEKNITERIIRINHLMLDCGIKDPRGIDSSQGGIDSSQGGIDSSQGGIDSSQGGIDSSQPSNTSSNTSSNTKNIISISHTSLQEESTRELSTSKPERDKNKNIIQKSNSKLKASPEDYETAKRLIQFLCKQKEYIFGNAYKITVSNTELVKLAAVVHGKDLSLLKDQANIVAIKENLDYPVGYLISCLKNLPDEQEREDV